MAAKGSDSIITQQVNLKLSNRGIRSPCKVIVQTHNGDVTLSGTVQHSHQKSAAVQAASGVMGVRRVTDQTKVQAART